MYKYTSKTSEEIKTIIETLEDAIIDAKRSGDKKVDYNGTKYEISDFVRDIESQIGFWLQKLQWALETEGEINTSKSNRFTRYEGYA